MQTLSVLIFLASIVEYLNVLMFRTYSEGLRLIQAPITELNQLRRSILSLQDITIKPDMNVLSAVSAAKMEIIA